jgi:hypothetical protein
VQSAELEAIRPKSPFESRIAGFAEQPNVAFGTNAKELPITWVTALAMSGKRKAADNKIISNG